MNKNMKTLCLVLFALSFLLVHGCATGTKVFVNDQYMGKTPAVVCLEREKTYRVILQRGGDESVMNIKFGTNSYKPVFFGASLFVDMNNGALVQGAETLDNLGNITFQRTINIHVPRDTDLIAVKFVTEDNSPFDFINEEFVKKLLSICPDNSGNGNKPFLQPLQADEIRPRRDNTL